MALDPVPFYTGGGAIHSPDAVRGLVYAATSGGTGVTTPLDFKVTQLPTAGGAVRILVGSGTARSRYPGAIAESYGIRGRTATDVPVSATGSGAGSVRYVILRVKDPQFAGEPAPASIPNGPYNFAELVSSITNLAYPYIPLAQINQPASTSAITSAMITDIRRLANPNSDTLLETLQGFANLDLNQTVTFAEWPGYRPTLFVPEWASRAKLKVEINGAVQFGGPTYGNLYTRFCGMDSQHSAWDINAAASNANPARVPPIMDKWNNIIPAAMRGTSQQVQVMARRNTASTDPGRLRADSFTQVYITAFFSQDVE